MNMTITEYAQKRGVTKQTIYTAIKRHPEINEHMINGVSNGKAANYLTDEAQAMLDELVKGSVAKIFEESSNALIIERNKHYIESQDKLIAEQRNEFKTILDTIISSVNDIEEQAKMKGAYEELKAKTEELYAERKQLLDEIDGLKQQITGLNTMLTSKELEYKQLKDKFDYACQHPFKTYNEAKAYKKAIQQKNQWENTYGQLK